MKQVFPVKERHRFRDQDLIAGHPALDFVNTVTGRNGAARDWLADPQAMLSWARKAGMISADEARALGGSYSKDPGVALAALQKAVELREALFGILDSLTSGEAPPKPCSAILEEHWHGATATAHLRWLDEKGLGIALPTSDADLVSKRVALAFVGLGPTLASSRLRKCPGHSCAWMFLDTSKAGRRRWCDMAVCGNAAKYERSRDNRRHHS